MEMISVTAVGVTFVLQAGGLQQDGGNKKRAGELQQDLEVRLQKGSGITTGLGDYSRTEGLSRTEELQGDCGDYRRTGGLQQDLGITAGLGDYKKQDQGITAGLINSI